MKRFAVLIYFKPHIGGEPDILKDSFITRDDAIKYVLEELPKRKKPGQSIPTRILVAEHIEDLET